MTGLSAAGRRFLVLLGTVALFIATPIRAATDIVVADFEGKDYAGWKVEGESFGPGPAHGTLPNQMKVTGFMGRGLVNSFYGGDGSTGRLVSPPFRIQRTYLNLLVGGGKHPGKTCINLLVEGKTVRTATGPNDRPGGSERLAWHTWDVSEFKGKDAIIEIVDQRTAGWGHINVDHIVQSDRRFVMPDLKKEFTIEKAFLHIPVRNGAQMRRMKLTIEGKLFDEFDIELGDNEIDWWAFIDVSRFKGKTALLEVDQPHDSDPTVPDLITQGDEIRGCRTLYKEKYRPQVHFSPRRGWNNDPNGLVYYDGEYHLFFQHNPYGWKWGNMHWGHAVSKDLVHWRELAVAIYPFKHGDWVYSGSAAVDKDNTAGLKTGDEDVIAAAYTSTGRGEAIAYSNDRGRTFIDYEGNPVVKHRGRDPKVIWYEPGGHWVMVVYDERDNSKGLAFYTSPDLKTWQYQSRIDGYYECPEIYELPVDGDKKNTRWVVYSGNGDYSIGAFDGKAFSKESGKHPFNRGNCFYASQTFNNIPPEDGRRIQIAWGRMGHPSMPFNQMMDFPVELTLRTTDEGIRMFAQPVREIELLHEKKHDVKAATVSEGGENPLSGIEGELFHIRAEFQIADASAFGFSIRSTPVTYDVEKQALTCGDKSAPLKPIEGKIRLELVVDRTTVEIFGNDGAVYMPMGVIHPDNDRSLGMFTRGGSVKLNSLEVFELRSAWE